MGRGGLGLGLGLLGGAALDVGLEVVVVARVVVRLAEERADHHRRAAARMRARAVAPAALEAEGDRLEGPPVAPKSWLAKHASSGRPRSCAVTRATLCRARETREGAAELALRSARGHDDEDAVLLRGRSKGNGRRRRASWE